MNRKIVPDCHIFVSTDAFKNATQHLFEKLDFYETNQLEFYFYNNKLSLTKIINGKHKEQIEINASGFWPERVKVSLEEIFEEIKSDRLDDPRISIGFYSDSKALSFGLRILKAETENQIPFNFELPLIQKPAEKSIHEKIKNKIQSIDDKNLLAPPELTEAIVNIYERDKELTSLIKKLRGNKCQICGYSFKTTNGENYSECHHLEHLSNHGLDVSKNIIVLCANHHRQAHYGEFEVIEHNEDFVKIKIENSIFTCFFDPDLPF